MLDSDYTRVSSMSSTKGIINIYITQSWKFISKALNSLGFALDLFTIGIFNGSFLFSVESYIFAQENASLWSGYFIINILSNTII